MTDAQTRLLRINAALDGELGALDQAAFERELREDRALAAEFARLSALRAAVQRAAPREPAPASLRARIGALAAPPTVASARPERAPQWWALSWSARGAMALAASFAALGFALGVGLTALRPGDATRGGEVAAVSDFARAAIAGQPYDVASSDRHTVKPWLATRTTVSASIVDLAAEGFPLAGGRVSIIDRIPAPTLVYRDKEHFIAVTELPRGGGGGSAKPQIEAIDGYHVARWSDAELSFVAVTDADEAALAKFVSIFREARKPANGETSP